MTRSEIAVFRRDTGELLYLAPRALAPTDDGLATLVIPEGYSSETFEWSASTRRFSESPAKLDALLIAGVKAEAERRKMLVMTPGGAKKVEYAEKRMEVAKFDTLGSTLVAIQTALGLMSAEARASNFAHASAEATARGESTILPAIARFRAGMDGSSAFARICAIEAKACAAIKAATSLTAKRAAAASVAWPT